MDSIRSVLIRTCMTNIQKEISQLEHWLLHLPTTDTTLPTSTPIPPPTDLSSIFSSLDKLTKQLDGQQHILNHIIDRVDVLESTREVHIQQSANPNTPWIDEFTTSIENDIVDDNLSDLSDHPIYTVHKTSQSNSPNTPSTPLEQILKSHLFIQQEVQQEEVQQQEVQQEVEQEEVQEEVQQQEVQQEIQQEVQQEEVQQEVEQEEVQQEEVQQEEVQQEEVQQEEVQQEEVQQEEVQQEEVQQEVEQEEVQQEEVQQEEVQQVEQQEVTPVQEVEETIKDNKEEEEEEEEEEGIELEEIEYKGVTYYKDNEKFIYTIDEEGQPSDTAVGYWKEKTQSIAFYKSK